MPTLVEIGPSNASQVQHRRKDSTEKKNIYIYGYSQCNRIGQRNDCLELTLMIRLLALWGECMNEQRQ